ncbi:Protein of unknown function [Cotesia congregata]|uniref:Uncharacterized protein n=1 Tax=Cotesia congregata TaxID=51543 RepID=A0A8J2E9Y0_COTCN|nr:Protein of unknown function [Cotesia congregata]
MHCVFLGVVKQNLRLCFDSLFSGCEFSLRKSIKYVDEKIKSIKPPSYTSRLPRSVSDYKYWKASELKNWLLYYSLVILKPIMTAVYYEHHKLLVLAISYLSQSSISQVIIDAAQKALDKYVRQYPKLCDPQHMTCNLHQLRHLAKDIFNLGPLPIF